MHKTIRLTVLFVSLLLPALWATGTRPCEEVCRRAWRRCEDGCSVKSKSCINDCYEEYRLCMRDCQ